MIIIEDTGGDLAGSLEILGNGIMFKLILKLQLLSRDCITKLLYSWLNLCLYRKIHYGGANIMRAFFKIFGVLLLVGVLFLSLSSTAFAIDEEIVMGAGLLSSVVPQSERYAMSPMLTPKLEAHYGEWNLDQRLEFGDIVEVPAKSTLLFHTGIVDADHRSRQVEIVVYDGTQTLSRLYLKTDSKKPIRDVRGLVLHWNNEEKIVVEFSSGEWPVNTLIPVEMYVRWKLPTKEKFFITWNSSKEVALQPFMFWIKLIPDENFFGIQTPVQIQNQPPTQFIEQPTTSIRDQESNFLSVVVNHTVVGSKPKYVWNGIGELIVVASSPAKWEVISWDKYDSFLKNDTGATYVRVTSGEGNISIKAQSLSSPQYDEILITCIPIKQKIDSFPDKFCNYQIVQDGTTTQIKVKARVRVSFSEPQQPLLIELPTIPNVQSSLIYFNSSISRGYQYVPPQIIKVQIDQSSPFIYWYEEYQKSPFCDPWGHPPPDPPVPPVPGPSSPYVPPVP